MEKVLLHVCCAPCSGSVIDDILAMGKAPTLFFYNPNIYPEEEYWKRKQEVIRYAKKLNLAFVEQDYEPEKWVRATVGFEKEPECGRRCDKCFELRLLKTASYALSHGFKVFTTTLGLSRWKNSGQVLRAGLCVQSQYPTLTYLTTNWRLRDGEKRGAEISKRENFYRQRYCGCVFSARHLEVPGTEN